MARKMNIPTGNDLHTPREIQKLPEPIMNIELLESEFKTIQHEISNELGYQGLSSYEMIDRLKKDKRFNEDKGVFDVMLKIWEDYGTCMQKCDDIIDKIDNTNTEFYKEVNDFTLRIEKEHISLIEHFVNLDKKKRFEYMNVTPESIRIPEINQLIHNIDQSKFFPEKHKQMLIDSFKDMINQLNSEYDTIKEAGIGSIIGSIFIAVIAIYIICKIITFFLWDWVGYLFWIGYLNLAIQRYKQLLSVAKTHGESGGLKMFLYALGHPNKG